MAKRRATTFGARVKLAREAAELSQEQLAESLDMSQQAVAKMEGPTSKGSRKLMEICELLGVTAPWLLKGQGPMRPQTGDSELDALLAEKPATYLKAGRLFDQLADLNDEQMEAISSLLVAFSRNK